MDNTKEEPKQTEGQSGVETKPENTEPAFTSGGYDYSRGVNKININPKREDILKAKTVKMFVKGNDGSYREVYQGSAKMKDGYIEVSDLNIRNNPTILSKLLVIGDNEVRFEFDGVSEPVNVVLIRTGKYTFRLSLKK